MSDSPTDGLSPLMDMRIKLTEAEKEIERLTAENELNRNCKLAVVIAKEWLAEQEAKIERLTRIEEKYTNLCNVLNDQTKEIEQLEGLLQVARKSIPLPVDRSDQIERLIAEHDGQ